MTQDTRSINCKPVEALIKPQGSLAHEDVAEALASLDRGKVLFPEKTTTQDILVPKRFDVLCGRQCVAYRHAGNKNFRSVILMNRERYQTAKSRDIKRRITNEVVDLLCDHRPGGRFLKQDPKTKTWYSLGRAAAHEKVSHALRSAKDPNKKKPPKRKPMRKKPLTKEEDAIFNQLLADQQRIFEELLRETFDTIEVEETPSYEELPSPEELPSQDMMDIDEQPQDQSYHDEWCAGRFIAV